MGSAKNASAKDVQAKVMASFILVTCSVVVVVLVSSEESRLGAGWFHNLNYILVRAFQFLVIAGFAGVVSLMGKGLSTKSSRKAKPEAVRASRRFMSIWLTLACIATASIVVATDEARIHGGWLQDMDYDKFRMLQAVMGVSAAVLVGLVTLLILLGVKNVLRKGRRGVKGKTRSK